MIDSVSTGGVEIAHRNKFADTQSADPVAVAIRKFQSGQRKEESFRLLFETYQPSVIGFFRNRGFSVDESRDLTQEAFFRMY